MVLSSLVFPPLGGCELSEGRDCGYLVPSSVSSILPSGWRTQTCMGVLDETVAKNPGVERKKGAPQVWDCRKSECARR